MNTRYIEFTLNTEGSPAGVLLVDDAWFGRCAQLSLQQQLNFGTAQTLGLSGERFACSVWLKITDLATTMTFLGDQGLSLAPGGKIKLVGADSDAQLLLNQWHYLCWSHDGQHSRLYLDGELKHSVAATDATIASDKTVSYSVSAGAVLLANQHFYRHDLTLPEVIVDRASRLPATATTFSHYYPLNLAIRNPAEGRWQDYPDNNLFIVDHGADQLVNQQLSISNVSRQDIHLVPFADGADIRHYHHFTVKVRSGVFTQPETYPQLTAIADEQGWQIQRALQPSSQDGSWHIYIRSTVERILTVNQHLQFNFDYTSADAAFGARSSRLQLNYQGLRFDQGGEVIGERNHLLSIINLSANNPYIDRLLDRVNHADEQVDDLRDQINKLTHSGDNDLDGEQINSRIQLLNQRITALDDRESSNSQLTDERLEALETGYPLQVFYDTPSSLCCNERNSLNIYVYNNGNTQVQLPDAAQIQIAIPFGMHKTDLAQTHVENGIVEGVFVNEVASSGFVKASNPHDNMSVFTWAPDSELTLESGDCLRFALAQVDPNNRPGCAMVQVRILHLNNQQDREVTLGVSKQASREPEGIIVMWSGTEASVPEGWAICDGRFGTPDLRDRFILACPEGIAPGQTGGHHSYSLTTAQLPSHTHSVIDQGHSHTVTDPGHSHTLNAGYKRTDTDVDDDSLDIYAPGSDNRGMSHVKTGIRVDSSGANISLGSTGNNTAIDNRPQYHTLFYIMKTRLAAYFNGVAPQQMQFDYDNDVLDSLFSAVSLGGRATGFADVRDILNFSSSGAGYRMLLDGAQVSQDSSGLQTLSNQCHCRLLYRLPQLLLMAGTIKSNFVVASHGTSGTPVLSEFYLSGFRVYSKMVPQGNNLTSCHLILLPAGKSMTRVNATDDGGEQQKVQLADAGSYWPVYYLVWQVDSSNHYSNSDLQHIANSVIEKL